MSVLRVETRPLFGPLLEDLCVLLDELSPAEWARATSCPGWTVHDIAAHLLGVEMANVSFRRDGWRVGPDAGEPLDDWINGFNDDWVAACRRMSPAVVVSLLRVAAEEFNHHLFTLDLDAMGGPVHWAGDGPAPVWLDVAREFMERAAHQAQIRWATSRSPLRAEFLAAVTATAVHGLPVALAGIARPAGTTVEFSVHGAGGGRWYVVSDGSAWQLRSHAGQPVTCRLWTDSPEDALRLVVRDPAAPPLQGTGDPDLRQAVARTKSVLG